MRRTIALGILLVLAGGGARAFEPSEGGSYLRQKAFSKPELYISSSNEAVEEAMDRLPNRAAWESFQATREGAGKRRVHAFIDPRSGTATSVVEAVPLIPGHGKGNRVTLEDLGARVGRVLARVDTGAVADAVLAFVRGRKDLLGIDTAQLGAVRAVEVTPDLWQIGIQQTYKGVPVRHGRLAATLNSGNLVLIGTETWGNVRGLSAVPKLSPEQALAAGFEHAGGRDAVDEVLGAPRLEVIPVAPPELQRGEAFDGPIGAGYRHRLAWTFAFRRPPEVETWEVIVDAHTGEMLAFQDTNQYDKARISGGVYPLTSTEVCPNTNTCGVMQGDWPMPFANTDTTLSKFANSAGIFDWTSGTVTTTLSGKYFEITDTCKSLVNSSTTGTLSLGGMNGEHDCAPLSASYDSPARSVYYEVNKLAEIARGWRPGFLPLNRRFTANVNLADPAYACNSYWDSVAKNLNFFRAMLDCRNSGEIASIIDHEWGHALDQHDFDVGASLSNPSEAYADIAAIYRLQTSCLGYGVNQGNDQHCGQTSDGTGFNANEAADGTLHCDLECSGSRDANYLKHSPNTSDTPRGFVCASCGEGSGPCDKEEHCAGAPAIQAAWDFATRDLQAAPFNLDSQTAFIVANRLFYQGSGKIGAWYTCTCATNKSDGCSKGNAYLEWLAADDDNGDLHDGTPHMTALYNAFDRHEIACKDIDPVNSGCAGGPSAAPTLSATPGSYKASLSWTAVPGAIKYWVFRTEGIAGCNFGKARIAADLAATTRNYDDTQVADGRTYYYNVVAAGSSEACFGRASNCVAVTPATTEYALPVELPPLPPGGSTVTTGGYDLSETGYIAGYSGDGNNRRAVRWLATATTISAPLNVSPSAVSTGYGVNDSGAVAGESGGQAFLWRSTTTPNLQPIPPPSSGGRCYRAWDVNNNNWVVGSHTVAASGVLHPISAFRWVSGQGTTLYDGSYRSTLGSSAFALNESGTFVGAGEVAPSGSAIAVQQGFVWQRPSAPVQTTIGALDNPDGPGSSLAEGINTQGQVVGGSEGQAVMWKYPEGLAIVGPGLGKDVNDQGVIVGHTGQYAWVKKPGVPAQNLNSLIPANSGWALLEAHAIDNQGWIVGFGRKTIPAPPGTPGSGEGEPATTTVIRGFLLRPQSAAPPPPSPEP